MVNPDKENGWDEWSKHVLAELERQNDNIEKLFSITSQCRIEIAQLQVKSSVWGGLAGAVTALATIFMSKLS
tara:strand:+ start:225 stop:440 length:216 start_codon:yes stop_codon:yes gene_type:complete